MANPSPAFQMYPRDFLADTTHMTAEEVGAYWLILCTAWIGDRPGYLPNDHELLALTGRLRGKSWSRCSKAILRALKVTDDGLWLYSKRMVAEWEKQQAHRQQASDAGKKSAEARAQQKVNDRSTTVQRPFDSRSTDTSTESNSASASASASSEKDIHTRVRVGSTEQGVQEMALLAAWEAAALPGSPAMWTLATELRKLPEPQRMQPHEVMGCFKRLLAKWGCEGLTTRPTVENLIKNLSLLVQIHRGELVPEQSQKNGARPEPPRKKYEDAEDYMARQRRAAGDE